MRERVRWGRVQGAGMRRWTNGKRCYCGLPCACRDGEMRRRWCSSAGPALIVMVVGNWSCTGRAAQKRPRREASAGTASTRRPKEAPRRLFRAGPCQRAAVSTVRLDGARDARDDSVAHKVAGYADNREIAP